MNFRKRTVAVATTLFRRARDAGLHNWHARQRAAGAGPRETPMPAAPPRETTTQAVAVLDAQFAWLRGAEKPGRQRRTGLPNSAQR